jgi:hypothetical protein
MYLVNDTNIFCPDAMGAGESRRNAREECLAGDVPVIVANASSTVSESLEAKLPDLPSTGRVY